MLATRSGSLAVAFSATAICKGSFWVPQFSYKTGGEQGSASTGISLLFGAVRIAIGLRLLRGGAGRK